jgi:putative hemolysin
MDWATGIFIIVISTLGNGFFAGVETGLTSAREIVLLHRARGGGWWSRISARLMERREDAIIGAVVGNNVTVVIGSAAATAAFVTRFGDRGDIYAAVVMSAITVLFGEALPKAAFRARPEGLLWLAGPPYRLLEILLFPITWLAATLSRAILALLRVAPSKQITGLSRQAIQLVLRMSVPRYEGRRAQQQLLDRCLSSLSRPVRERLTPFERVSSLEPDAKVRDAVALVHQSGHSRLPLRDGRGGFGGLILFRDLLDASDDTDVLSIARKIPFLGAEMELDAAIASLLRRRGTLAAVRERSGEILGIITLEDLLEPLVGEINDEHDQPRASRRSEQTGESFAPRNA